MPKSYSPCTCARACCRERQRRRNAGFLRPRCLRPRCPRGWRSTVRGSESLGCGSAKQRRSIAVKTVGEAQHLLQNHQCMLNQRLRPRQLQRAKHGAADMPFGRWGAGAAPNLGAAGAEGFAEGMAAGLAGGLAWRQASTAAPALASLASGAAAAGSSSLLSLLWFRTAGLLERAQRLGRRAQPGGYAPPGSFAGSGLQARKLERVGSSSESDSDEKAGIIAVC